MKDKEYLAAWWPLQPAIPRPLSNVVTKGKNMTNNER